MKVVHSEVEIVYNTASITAPAMCEFWGVKGGTGLHGKRRLS
jgi:hypothetical protein